MVNHIVFSTLSFTDPASISEPTHDLQWWIENRSESMSDYLIQSAQHLGAHAGHYAAQQGLLRNNTGCNVIELALQRLPNIANITYVEKCTQTW